MTGLDRDRLVSAAIAVAESCGSSLVEVARSFGCIEAELVAELLEAAGRRSAAVEFLAEHALGDGPGDAHFLNPWTESLDNA